MDNKPVSYAALQQIKKVNQERYNLGSKKRLMKVIEKKCKTSMIGTLARCEDRLGYLWGHNSNRPLTSQQKEFAKIWEELRTDILNHCNSQLRAVLEEILQYTVTWNQYHTDFIIKKG